MAPKTNEIDHISLQEVQVEVVQKHISLELILLEILLEFIPRLPGRWNIVSMESLAELQLEKK